jgi:hypothetical protein
MVRTLAIPNWRVLNSYLLVLASKKDSGPTIQKGKDQDIQKWEAELRKSLESKKAAKAATLSKQDQALVNAQLAKESKIRKDVTLVHQHFERGLSFIRALVAAEVEQFQFHVAPLATLLLEGVLRKAAPLVGPHAFETYLV